VRVSLCRICLGCPKRCRRGNTLRKGSCVHWIYGDVGRWLRRQPDGTHVVGVQLTDASFRLADLPAARTRTVVVLGNEGYGRPPEALEVLDVAVEIPMIGTGDGLNVAVVGSLVLYKLAGLLQQLNPVPSLFLTAAMHSMLRHHPRSSPPHGLIPPTRPDTAARPGSTPSSGGP
jgi:SpoU rRNA Methylase family